MPEIYLCMMILIKNYCSCVKTWSGTKTSTLQRNFWFMHKYLYTVITRDLPVTLIMGLTLSFVLMLTEQCEGSEKSCSNRQVEGKKCGREAGVRPHQGKPSVFWPSVESQCLSCNFNLCDWDSIQKKNCQASNVTATSAMFLFFFSSVTRLSRDADVRE